MKEIKNINGSIFESDGEWIEINYSEELNENDDYEEFSYFRINGDIERIADYMNTDRNGDLHRNGLHASKPLCNWGGRFLELNSSLDAVKVWYNSN